MNEISPEMRLEKYYCPIIQGSIYKLIDHQVRSHAVAAAEYGCKSKGDAA